MRSVGPLPGSSTSGQALEAAPRSDRWVSIAVIEAGYFGFSRRVFGLIAPRGFLHQYAAAEPQQGAQ